MIAEFGHFALLLALASGLTQAVLLFLGARRGDITWMAAGRHAAVAGAALVVLAFAILLASSAGNGYAPATPDGNAREALPLAYRVAAAWCRPEGSLLLACVALAAWTLAFRFAPGPLERGLECRALGILGLASAGLLAVAVTVANPFARRALAASPGLDPSLQDPSLLLHLPLLVAGGTGLAVAFALALAAASDDRLDGAWARQSRPWALRSWLVLTAGIIVGSLWGDREPLSGGWWSWEPLQGTTLMSWLAATALLHSLSLSDQRGMFRRWTAFVAVLAFPVVLLGEWIVRGGATVSKYGHAPEPANAAAFLLLFAILAGGAVAVLARRAEGGAAGPFEMLSREAALAANGMLLLAVLAAVLQGLLQPSIAALLGAGRAGVGASYFNAVFMPLMVPVLALMGPAPRLRWGGESAGEALRHVFRPAVAALAAAAAAAGLLQGRATAWMVVGVFLSSWIAWHCAEAIAARWRRVRPAGDTRTAAANAASFHAAHLAHLGVALLVAGASLSGGLLQTAELAVAPGATESAGFLRLRAEGASRSEGPNYRSVRLRVVVIEGGRETVLEPELRYFRAGGTPTAKPATRRGLARDLHVSLAVPEGGAAWAIRVRVQPFMSLVWAGMALVVAGGLLALAGRRRGSPSPRRAGTAGAAPDLALERSP